MKLIFSALFSLLLLAVKAQNVKVTSTDDFIHECTKNMGELPHKQLVLWIPVNFWDIIGDKLNLPAEQLSQMTAEMSKYMMVCVVDYTLNPGNDLTFKTEDELMKTITLTDSSKNEYYPLAKSDLTATAGYVLETFKPVMAQMLGQFGRGMCIFLFKQKMIAGKPAIDITKKNSFSIGWNNAKANWQLPLVSTLPPKYCPVDHEQMKGNWSFCPIHGVKLD